MQMQNLLILAAFLVLPGAAMAQEPPSPINSGRPGFSETLGIIPSGRIQQEMGYVFSRVGSSREHGLGQLMLRLGTGGGTELQLGANSFALTRNPEGNTSGIQDSTIGFKIL